MALTDIPSIFQPDDEEEIRIAIAHYFRELGFEATEMSFEDKFSIQLGHTSLELGIAPKRAHKSAKQRTRVSGRSDLLLARHGRPLAIIETKAPNHTLTEQDALQALSYARLLVDMAPYAIVTNGKETRVYDTFARSLDVLDVPTESLWYKQGKQVPSIGDDLRSQAAHILIGINAQTLHLFCQKQVSVALEDLKGTAYEGKPYIPEAYVSRLDASKQLSAWLTTTNQPCFALIGNAGIGKTTFLCATAEQYLAKDYFILFYSASTLKDTLEAAIRNDFVWEFHRERGLAHIIERFDEIAHTHGKTFLIILDALDRFPGKPEKLKAELLDLIPRLRGRHLRLCLSCKSFDWPTFVIDDTRSFNKLAAAIYPPLPQPQNSLLPNAASVGTWLHEYTDAEVDQIFAHYQQLFSLQGALQETVRKACYDPLLLRLLAEVYSHQNEVLPRTLSQRELFERYWIVQLSKMRHPWEAEQWLTALAHINVESCERQVSLTELRSHLSSFATQQETYDDLLRTNLLTVTTDLSGQSLLSFTLDPFLSYVYALKAQTWTHQIRQGKSQQVATSLCQLLFHPIGVEVVEFYMRTIDQGKTRLLTEIALLDIYRFVQLLEILQGRSFVSATPPGGAHQQAIYDYLTQFISAYSELSHAYFPALCDRIEPYKGEVGLWISTSLGKTMYQFRRRTVAKPEPLLILSPTEAESLWPVPHSQEIRTQIHPYGSITQTFGDPSLIEHLPQKTAWHHILSQVARLFVTRALDESSTPSLLQERVWYTLLDEPHIFSGGVPVTGPFWQVFGFSAPEEIPNTSLEELLKRTQTVIERYKTQLMTLAHQHGYQSKPPGLWWYSTYIQKLQRLRYCLQKLQTAQSPLLFPSWNRYQLFEYLRTGDFLSTLALVRQFLPPILQSYRFLVQKNVSAFADHLALFTHSNASFLIEVIPEPSLPAFRSDLLQITYALLPSIDLPEKYLVYTCQEQDSLMHIPFRQLTLEGHWTETSGRQGAGFGQGKIAQSVEGRFIDEPNAFFYVTQFPNHHPILDQVYQLLGNELSTLLRGNHRDWLDNASGRIDDEMLDILIKTQLENT